MPSSSLILSICHSELARFSTRATRWGYEHEKTAHAHYESLHSGAHEDFTVLECGLFIHPTHPFMGMSPDGLVNCICCGEVTFCYKCISVPIDTMRI